MKSESQFRIFLLVICIVAGVEWAWGYVWGKKDADHWYAQHWHPDLRYTDILDPNNANQHFTFHCEDKSSSVQPLDNSFDKLRKSVDILDKQTSLSAELSQVTSDCLRVGIKQWKAKHCDARINKASDKFDELQKEHAALKGNAYLPGEPTQ